MACIIFDESSEEHQTDLIINGVPILSKENNLLNNWDLNIEDKITNTQNNYQPTDLLNSLSYSMKDKSFYGLKQYDYIITYSWDISNDNWFGAVSAWYDAFELWNITTINTKPAELGGKKIALLFPDCPNRGAIYQILLAILSKYQITESIFKSLCQNIYFLHKPKEFILTKGEIPYTNYSPSNLIFIDGKIPQNIKIQADNIYLSLIDNLPEYTLSRTNYNFLFIYRDKRIFDLSKNKDSYPHVRPIQIARLEYPNTMVFDDIRRIDFNLFKKEQNLIDKTNKKRILLYMTEKNKRHQLKEDSNNWTDHELDDIINSIPNQYLNPLAQEVKRNQKELYGIFKNSLKNLPKGTPQKEKELTKDQLYAIKEKGTIFGNGFSIDDVIVEESLVHFIIVGLTDKNREFETALLKRAMERGINISTEVYLQKELPIIDIHSKYDIYLFTPMYKWCTSRFISEALFHKKNIILTKEALATLRWNLPLNIRYNDSIKYLMFLAEDDIFRRPKSLLARNILGYW